MNDEDVMRIVKRTRDPNDIGTIKRTPGVMGGKPVIAGTRIAPEFVWSFHEAGLSTEQIIEQYTHLHPEDVDAAIAYEVEQRKQSAKRSQRTSESRALPVE